MPHFVLEYSDNILEEVDFKDFFQRLHALLVENGPFNLSAIKSRAIRHQQFCVADGKESNAFVHLTLSIFKGRDLSIRQAVGEKILSFLKKEFARSFQKLNCSYTVALEEIDKDTYFRATSGEL
ncbi:MAG: 5-carboxymethyl-2-hydroxymuconate isomerase [candidate division Zixibacteria bacterium]|nr:5-carboxymethyl-2-hydroxymuconate isomerase [candidate division Zixibacteria bacterium]